MTEVRTATPARSTDINDWIGRMLARAPRLPCAFRVHLPGGAMMHIGEGEPEFDLSIHNEAGMAALRSTSELRIADAYVRGDLDIQGDVFKAMWLRDLLDDRHLWLKIWRRLQPLLVGRERLNPAWIAKHYDSRNIQIHALDNEYHAYTPGVYLRDDETLEVSTERKYQFAFDSLGLKPGQHLLEIGCGWGGMTRFCASRGVNVTAITLSNDQMNWTKGVIEQHKLANATVSYQDFFAFNPGRRFDAISCMGVIEDLSDYPRVMQRFSELLAPGARAYLDFASGKVPFGTSSFITKYVWPGTFRMVYMPELMKAIDESKIQLVAVYNDRHNYHLWARKGHERWTENKEKVLAEADMETYRLFDLLFIGTAGVMNNPSHEVTAYRLVLELPGPRGVRQG
jgi:cyclopropane-fatty-acyl-phospholipid synthase